MKVEYVALFRGINIGRNKRVAMAELRAMLEGLGFGNVRTVLNSGNAFFTAPRAHPLEIAGQVERKMETEIGFSARVAILTSEELNQVAADNPLVEIATDPSRLVVTVFRDFSGREVLTPLVKQDWTPDVLAVGEKAAYMWCPKGLLESRVVKAAGRLLQESATSRNWSTILRLQRSASSTVPEDTRLE